MNIRIARWLPACFVMLLIFVLSAQPSFNLPSFTWGDKFLKKAGHVVGYGILSWSLWYGFTYRGNRRWTSWLLAVIYALTDEFHQSFVPGRNPSIWDAIIFDNLGAMISLWLVGKWRIQKWQDPPASDRHST